MQTATSETEIKSLYLSKCVHHYTLRAPCPKGQGIALVNLIQYAILFSQQVRIQRTAAQSINAELLVSLCPQPLPWRRARCL